MVNSVELEVAILRSGFTKKELAQEIGVSYGALRNKINNLSEFKSSEVNLLCVVLRLSEDKREAIFFEDKLDLKSYYSVAERIRYRRESLDMSQGDLATLLGYTDRSSISKIETGKSDFPLSKLEKFACALETTTAYLMGHCEGEQDERKKS